MNILVVGGAGYIGSHMVKKLVIEGHRVISLDNLSTGFKSLAKYGKLIVGDLSDNEFLDQLFSQNKFDAVMHFAASSLVGESIVNPAKYYRNNVVNTINLLDVMVKHDVRNFIFSSTAAIFGEPIQTKINEQHPKMPINPYGKSKLMIEMFLEDYASVYGLNSVSLRYFNAAGADPEGELGECHQPETHLIPLVLQVASGRRDYVTVFGSDYDTSDGTCIRDYIHVIDLCEAHKIALEKLMSSNLKGAKAFNLGNGDGFSVQQVIDVCKELVAIDGSEINVIYGDSRDGDPAILVADTRKAGKELAWKPKFNILEDIINHAWIWEKKLLDAKLS